MSDNTTSENNDTSLSDVGKTTASTVGDQYPNMTSTETASVKKNGRFVISVADLEKVDFTNEGADGLNPHVNEILFDENNIPYIVRENPETGKLEPKSGVKNVVDLFQMLIDTGVIKQAYSFAMDSKIYRLFFDNQQRTLSLDSSLPFDKRHAFYAVRKHDLDSNGKPQYISGVNSIITGDDGSTKNISSHFISFLEKRSDDGESYIRYAGQGGLLEEVIEGDFYAVEYYDIDRKWIGGYSYQAISVRSLEYAMTPETALRDLLIVPNNSVSGDPDATYLYVGENPIDALSFRIFLKFADNQTLDITTQQTPGGRLVITGLDDLSTDQTTVSESAVQKIQFTYYFGENNANNAESGDTDSGAYLSKENLSITKEMKVYIRENVYDKVVLVEPTGWITPPTNDANQEVLLKFIAVYEDGRMSDITHQLRDNSERFSGFGNGTSVYDETRQAFVCQRNVIGIPTESCFVRVSNGTTNGYDKVSFYLQTTTSSKRLIVDNESSKFMDYNPNTKKMNFTGNPNLDTLKGPNNSMSLNGTLIQPTHVTIRSAMNPEKNLVTRMSLASIPFSDNGQFNYSNVLDGVIQTDYPLLVEFLYILQDSNGLNITVRTTAVHTYYCKTSTL